MIAKYKAGQYRDTEEVKEDQKKWEEKKEKDEAEAKKGTVKKPKEEVKMIGKRKKGAKDDKDEVVSDQKEKADQKQDEKDEDYEEEEEEEDKEEGGLEEEKEEEKEDEDYEEEEEEVEKKKKKKAPAKKREMKAEEKVAVRKSGRNTEKKVSYDIDKYLDEIDKMNTGTSGGGGIQVMLAKNYDPEKVDPTGWYMSEKLDGVRCYWDGKAMYTRNGHLFYPPDFFKAALPKMALDGELWSGRDAFQKIVSIVRR